MTARYDVRDGVAIITLDNPPVNGLGASTRLGIVVCLDRAASDPAVSAVVIMGAGRAFSGGADLRELNSRQATQAPSLATVLELIESSDKPVIAAIHATALGGGLELALAAHYRMALPAAQIGLPEVKIGLLPGCGGTQRLPRAVGLERALNMIVSGASVQAEQLAHTRLFDRVIDGDLLSAALSFAHEVSERGGPHPKIRDWRIEHGNADAFSAAGFIAFARTAVAATAKNHPAPLKCIDAIEAAVTRSFDEGLRLEREAFFMLLQTPQSRALRHAFLAERAAAKPAEIGEEIPPRSMASVAVVGAGTMGGGIAMNFLNVGIPVTLLEARPEALERGVATIRTNYENSARKGKLTLGELEQRLRLLRPTLSYDDLRDADLVIEAVFEDYAVKEGVFRKLDLIAKPGAILATNTSTLDVNRIAACTARPQDVLGLHFFSPAHVMKLLEVVRCTMTAKDALAAVLRLAGRIGKTAVLSGVCDGFIGNRMLEQYLRQAGFLLDEGALPAQIDRAMEKFGFAMGPFRVSDLAGNDISWAIRQRRAVEQPRMSYSKTAELVCELGRFGQKTGAGWYDYVPGDRTAHPSKQVEELIVAHSRSLGIPRRSIEDREIIERLVYALVNEGARILEDRIAARASDIDVVYLTGYGFPAWRGGPMFYADTVGLYDVVRAIHRHAKGYQGHAWDPAPLLVRLAESGQTFND